MQSQLPSEEKLIAELKATFPQLNVRPIREFKCYGFDYGVWTGSGYSAPFTDGQEIFNDLADEGYEGGVYIPFSKWLEERGWFVENYDGETMFILAIESVNQMWMSA